MPLACFGAISNVSVHWEHAKGMFLRYGTIVRVIFDGEIVFFGGVAKFFWWLRLFFCLSWGRGGGNLVEIVNFVG